MRGTRAQRTDGSKVWNRRIQNQAHNRHLSWLVVVLTITAALRPQSGEIVKTGDMSLVDQLEAGGYAVLSEAEH